MLIVDPTYGTAPLKLFGRCLFGHPPHISLRLLLLPIFLLLGWLSPPEVMVSGGVVADGVAVVSLASIMFCILSNITNSGSLKLKLSLFPT